MQALTSRYVLLSALFFAAVLSGCGVGIQPLMPTPVLYTECGFQPLEHVPKEERWTPRRVFFATVRSRTDDLQKIAYSNTPSDTMSVGLVLIGFGGPDMSWAILNAASTEADRKQPVKLSIAGVVEAGQFPAEAATVDAAAANEAGWFLENLNDAIDDARDKDILIYVHGAKVNFYNACAFAAQLDHFMGRDMTSVAFSWPTRQNLFTYVFGSDKQRAYDSASALVGLLELLATETEARRIHVLCWSAGGRVVARALRDLRERYAEESHEALRKRLRIGTAYFAAADVPLAEFLEALPAIHDVAGRVVVTVSAHDEALKSASLFMGGGARIGQHTDSATEEENRLVESFDRLEVVNVSLGREDRGFDITGHRYWFDHPWASSDVLLAIRTDLAPGERGLAPDDSPVQWYMPEDYPERLKKALEDATLRRW